MIRLKQMEALDVAEATSVIIAAYQEKSWNKEYNVESTKCFLMKCTSSERTRDSYVLSKNEKTFIIY